MDLRLFEDDEESWKFHDTQHSVLWTLPVIREIEVNPDFISRSNFNDYPKVLHISYPYRFY